MAQLPAAIDAALSIPRKEDRPGGIGASSIGNDCDAFLALTLREFPEDPLAPKVRRIFDVGHALEDMMVRYLKGAIEAGLGKAGWHLMSTNPATGKQYYWRKGHLRTFTDSILVSPNGARIVIEIKTMNAKKFAAFRDEGVRKSHQKYFAQAQLTMHLAEGVLCTFVAINKDTSEIATETVEFDEIKLAGYVAHAEIAMRNHARRKGDDPASFACRWCSKKGSCWGDVRPAPACVNCTSAEAKPDGTWWCNRHSRMAWETCADYALYAPLPKGS